jgi:hypothetical protein
MVLTIDFHRFQGTVYCRFPGNRSRVYRMDANKKCPETRSNAARTMEVRAERSFFRHHPLELFILPLIETDAKRQL